MATTTNDLSETIDAARKFAVAERRFERLMNQLEHRVEVLDDETFWPLLAKYRQCITRLSKTQGTEAAAHNLSCRLDLEGEEKAMLYLRFAKTYRRKDAQLSNALRDAQIDRGDDSYSDLMDNLVLAGPEVFDRAIEGFYGNETAIREAVETYLEAPVKASFAWTRDPEPFRVKERLGRLIRFIFGGENYNAMALDRKSREVFRWELAPYKCSKCEAGVAPILGLDSTGKCEYCSLDEEYIASCKAMRGY